MQQQPSQQSQIERFYRNELEELANARDAIRAKHRPDDRSSDSDYDSFSDDQGKQPTGSPRSGPRGYVDYAKVEAADMDTHIPANNVGYKLLLKMGWKAGTGLGQNASGRTAPIPINQKQSSLGIGKQEVDTWYGEISTSKRKALEAEKQAEETEDQRNKREEQAKQKQAIQAELAEVKSAFYCALCDKQYERIADYEVHLSSYDHHHKKRFKDMKETSRAGAAGTTSKIKEKEKKREERELAKMQEAALKRAGGGAGAGAGTGTTPATAVPPQSTPTPLAVSETSGFQPVELGGFQPVKLGVFQPVKLSGFQPVKSVSSTFGSSSSGKSASASSTRADSSLPSPPSTSLTGSGTGFQPAKLGGFQPVKMSGFQKPLLKQQSGQDHDSTPTEPSLSDTASTPEAGDTGFQPVKLGGFRPVKLGGVKTGGFQFNIKKPGTK
ncbi:G patch domain-containing protein 8 [Podila horticola]|nr:G patch domain-containing protein 8 [Podila horticola]